MASFDLEELIPDLVYSLQAPGSDEFANVSPEEWISRLRDGFWSAFNDGLLQGYVESDGVVNPRTGTTTIPRDQQQVVLLYTAINVLRQTLLRINTTFRAKAGPVEYETQQSAQLLKALLDDLSQRRVHLLERLAKAGVSSAVFLLDAYRTRQDSLYYHDTFWVGD